MSFARRVRRRRGSTLRATATTLGVHASTVNRDLAPVANATPEPMEPPADQGNQTERVANATPEWFQGGTDPARLAKGRAR